MVSQINTREGVKEIAPDAAAFEAGEKLASENWLETGRSERALWGEIQGSGEASYRVMIDARDDFAYKCSCPSRKAPCKHVLGLLLRNVDGALENASEPDDLVQWLDGRDQRAAKRLQKQGDGEAGDDGEADERKLKEAQKRREKTAADVAEGVATLLAALDNVARVGLRSDEVRKKSFWQDLAKRMIDHKAPGLATRLNEIAALDPNEETWNEDVLRKVGVLVLLLEAASRIESLPVDLASEVRAALGARILVEDVRKNGERLEGEWLALGGVSVKGKGGFITIRNWFYNVETNRFARYIQYSSQTNAAVVSYEKLNAYQGAFRFWDGVVKFRAAWESDPENKGERKLPQGVGDTFDSLVKKTMETRAKAPWMTVVPTILKDVVVRPLATNKGNDDYPDWIVVDADGRAVTALAPASYDTKEGKHYFLQSFYEESFEKTITLFGEWDGRRLVPISTLN